MLNVLVKKRAVFVEEHLARLTVPEKIVSRGGSVVRTLPPFYFISALKQERSTKPHEIEPLPVITS
ncbi:MAG TPA: hypothetical protein DC054_01780 [Blastocatellia bacterium]|nr:hypothetical protein [Blastocatellia bacterium]